MNIWIFSAAIKLCAGNSSAHLSVAGLNKTVSQSEINDKHRTAIEIIEKDAGHGAK